MIRKYSSKDFERDRVGQWRDLMETTLKWPVDFDCVDEKHFNAEVTLVPLGCLAFISHAISPVIIDRQSKTVQEGQNRVFSLNFLLRGRMLLSHHNRQQTLNPGDIVLADGAIPSTLSFEEASEVMTVRIPASSLQSSLPSPENFCNLPQSSNEGFSNALREILFTLWQRAREGVPREFLEMSTKPFLDLLGLSYLMQAHAATHGRSPAQTRLARIKKYIDNNISDPALCPEVIACEFQLSSRYLRKLFAAEGDSISRYIQYRRLQTCASQLSNLFWRNTSITDICFSHGFNSSAHFTRAFKTQFGMTPKEYRRKVNGDCSVRL